MSAHTSIEWTTSIGPDGSVRPGHTFNPWSGCAKISAGCTNCYAAALPPKMRRGAEWGPTSDRVTASDSYWAQPRAWDRAAKRAGVRDKVFCASTADVFEARYDLERWRHRLFELIEETPNLDWLLLTKRPEFMADWAQRRVWPANAWAGTSVEDQRAADERIPHLMRVPASVRFLSCEPLLGPVDLLVPVFGAGSFSAMEGIQWVIAGGESGRNARPMHPDWARSLRDQCQQAGVPYLFKQWGTWGPPDRYQGRVDCARLLTGYDDPKPEWDFYTETLAEAELCHADDAPDVYRVGKERAGRLLDGVEHNAMPIAKP